ncbi:S1 family peptidase [Gigaspora margarita]|uniref:S1 family peptidase n=1 Tax=Gigaspora margarita TaxID=4874 RepID=A0A8H4A362_GIGMA|nr:S1 family peptidase [Gigaspora margarita]
MKDIYFLIIFIFTLQIHFTVHAYQHPLAILWKILNDQVNEYLEREDVLAIKEALVSSIMEIIGEESFGGIYVDVKTNKLIVNINNPALENSPLLDPYRDILLFNIVDRSLGELKVQFDQDVGDAKRRNVTNSYIYIDVETNNVILRPNLPPGLNTQPFGPRKHVPMRPRQVKPKVLAGEVDRSLGELKVQFDQDVGDAKRRNVTNSYIYIDVETNNVILRPNLPPGLNTQPFGPRKHVPMRPRQVKPKVLAGDGVFNRDNRKKNEVVGKTCSIGFYARGKKRDQRRNDTNYIITARSCYFKDSNLANNLYLRNWDTFTPHDGSNSFDVLPAIRNTDNPRYPNLYITDAKPAIIVGGHICHSGFGTHVTCGNIKALTAIYLNEDGSSSEGLIITDMNTRDGDIGGAIFFYKSTETHHVDLCGIQVTSGSNIAAVLPSNIILQNTKNLTLYKL